MQARRPKFLELFRFGLGSRRKHIVSRNSGRAGMRFRIPIGNEPEYVKHPVNAPAEYEFTCFLAIGYAAEDAHICKQKDIRVKERIHKNIW